MYNCTCSTVKIHAFLFLLQTSHKGIVSVFFVLLPRNKQMLKPFYKAMGIYRKKGFLSFLRRQETTVVANLPVRHMHVFLVFPFLPSLSSIVPQLQFVFFPSPSSSLFFFFSFFSSPPSRSNRVNVVFVWRRTIQMLNLKAQGTQVIT